MDDALERLANNPDVINALRSHLMTIHFVSPEQLHHADPKQWAESDRVIYMDEVSKWPKTIDVEVEVIAESTRPLPCKHYYGEWYKDECTLSHRVRCTLCQRTGSITDYKAYDYAYTLPYPHRAMSVDCLLHLHCLDHLVELDPAPAPPASPAPLAIGSISVSPTPTPEVRTNDAN